MPSSSSNPERHLDSPPSPGKFRCGNLIYTKPGIFLLFSWLLWGDFCFTLMETVWPKILPLMLKSQGTPNWLLALVITTIPSVMNIVMNPVISMISDRYRGKLGRRIPFLRVATPFVVFFLVLLGFSQTMGKVLHGLLSGVFPGLSTASVTIGTICFLVICFRFFELFVNTVFWYLFNDVVPPEFLGKFVSFFRVVGSLAGAFFNFFLFQYAESHTSALFLGVALLYGIVFMLMALNVKEGTYPPPEPIRSNPIDWVKRFFLEGLRHRIFRRIFAYSLVLNLSESINIFVVFMALSIGLSLSEIGKIAGVASVTSMILLYPMGYLVDRLHPLRIMLISKAGFCVVMSFQFVFLFHEFSKPVAFWIYAGITAISLPIYAVNAAAGLPMLMRLFPHAKFGQFCAANAMCMSLGRAVGGLMAGSFLDLMKSIFPAGQYFYRFVPVWTVFFMMLAFVAMVAVFREWKRLGGDGSYQPPPTDWDSSAPGHAKPAGTPSY